MGLAQWLSNITPTRWQRHEPEQQRELLTPSGARRSVECLYYHLIPANSIRRWARRCTIGAKKFGGNNYRKGLAEEAYVTQLIDHIEEHWLQFKEHGDATDDNTAAILWGIGALQEVERIAPMTLRRVLQSRWPGPV